jgi:hypothetical protein
VLHSFPTRRSSDLTNEGLELLLNRLVKSDSNVDFLAKLTKNLDQA